MARLTTYGSKRLPDLHTELERLRPKRKQSTEEMIAAMRAIKETMANGLEPDTL